MHNMPAQTESWPLDAVAYAKARASQSHVGVLADSMRASVSILAGAQTPAVEVFVLDSPFASTRRVLAYNFRQVVHLPFGVVAPLADQWLYRLAGYHFPQVEPLCRRSAGWHRDRCC